MFLLLCDKFKQNIPQIVVGSSLILYCSSIDFSAGKLSHTDVCDKSAVNQKNAMLYIAKVVSIVCAVVCVCVCQAQSEGLKY